jgi:acetoin utilization deacetylase AcuC-like enzyme
MDKYARTREALRRDAALVNKITLLESPKVDVESELLLTHCPEYVQRVLTLTLREDEVRKIGFPMAQQNVERSLASTGGTVACMREVMSGIARASAQIAGGDAPRVQGQRRRLLRVQRRRGGH